MHSASSKYVFRPGFEGIWLPSEDFGLYYMVWKKGLIKNAM